MRKIRNFLLYIMIVFGTKSAASARGFFSAGSLTLGAIITKRYLIQ